MVNIDEQVDDLKPVLNLSSEMEAEEIPFEKQVSDIILKEEAGYDLKFTFSHVATDKDIESFRLGNADYQEGGLRFNEFECGTYTFDEVRQVFEMACQSKAVLRIVATEVELNDVRTRVDITVYPRKKF